jgi:hypothetical protein
VAHAYSPSYSGGKEQEDCGAKPAWAPHLEKKPMTKRVGGVAQGVGPEFKTHTSKKKSWQF